MKQQIEIIEIFSKEVQRQIETSVNDNFFGKTDNQLKITLIDLVFRQGYRQQIHTYTNNELLYKNRNSNDFFYILRFDSIILKINNLRRLREELKKNLSNQKEIEERMNQVKSSFKNDYEEYEKFIFPRRKLEFKIDEKAWNIKKTSGAIKALREKQNKDGINDDIDNIKFKSFPFHSREDLNEYDGGDVKDFYQDEKKSQTIRIIKGAFFYSEKDYIAFVLAIGFNKSFSNTESLEESKINEKITETFKDKGFELELYELFADLFITDLIEYKNTTNSLNAFGQVMSRGMAHSNGSHMIPEYELYYRKHFEQQVDTTEQIFESDDYNFLRYYFEYTQQRMELIADISSLDKNRMLNSYEFIELYDNFNKLKDNVLAALWDSLNGDKKIEIKSVGIRGKKVSLPGGKLGVSALYLIFENIIRNQYKHAEILDKKTNYFYFSITSDERYKDYWQIDFYYSKKRGAYRKSYSSQEHNNTTLLKIQELVDNPITVDDDSLRKEGWGIIEINTACAYLRDYSIEELFQYQKEKRFLKEEKNITKKHPDLLQVRYYHGDDINVGEIGYRFYLKKTKEILFDTKFIIEPENNNKHFQDFGMYFNYVEPKQYKNEYDILVTKKNRKIVNQRILDCTGLTIDTSLDKEKLAEEIWKQYKNKHYKKIPQPIFDNHFKGYKNKSISEIRKITKQPYYGFSTKFNSKTGAFYIEYERKDIEQGNSSKEQVLFNELVSSKITIIDERIQKKSEYHKIQKNNCLTIRDGFELCDVMIPQNDFIDLNELNDTTDLENYILERIKLDDFLLIHYTLFKKVFPKCERIEDIAKIDKQLLKKMVFISGMGKTANIIEGIMFLNYPSLSDAVIKNPDKLTLVFLLKNLAVYQK